LNSSFNTRSKAYRPPSSGLDANKIDTHHPDLAQPGLASAFKVATAKLHTTAERSGIVNDMLKGRVNLYGYALFLRNLLPAYQEMERGFGRHALSPGVRLIAHPETYRARALEADLEALSGANWADQLPILPAASVYAARIAAIAEGDGARLIAHAYARYLGDLSGGQILKRLLAKFLGLDDRALNFYDFPAIADIAQFKADYREAIDRAASEIVDLQPIIDEASIAFQLNIDVSDAVRDAAGLSDAINRH
jgi:heme oxygenase